MPKVSNWLETIKPKVIDWLNKWLRDFLVKKILGAAVGGIKGFVFNFLFNKLWKQVIIPMLNNAFRKVEKKTDQIEYEEKGKKTEEAQNAEEWDHSVDDLFK